MFIALLSMSRVDKLRIMQKYLIAVFNGIDNVLFLGFFCSLQVFVCSFKRSIKLIRLHVFLFLTGNYGV